MMNEWRKDESEKPQGIGLFYTEQGESCVRHYCHSQCMLQPWFRKGSGTCLTWIPLKSIYLHEHKICSCYLTVIFLCIWRRCARKKQNGIYRNITSCAVVAVLDQQQQHSTECICRWHMLSPRGYCLES